MGVVCGSIYDITDSVPRHAMTGFRSNTPSGGAHRRKYQSTVFAEPAIWAHWHRVQQSEFLTPTEVAAILKISTDSVIRKFETFPGVLDIGAKETRFSRRHRVLRIPRESLERYIVSVRVQ
jgi:hypothetical protein